LANWRSAAHKKIRNFLKRPMYKSSSNYLRAEMYGIFLVFSIHQVKNWNSTEAGGFPRHGLNRYHKCRTHCEIRQHQHDTRRPHNPRASTEKVFNGRLKTIPEGRFTSESFPCGKSLRICNVCSNAFTGIHMGMLRPIATSLIRMVVACPR
jgi:hypothetical protein